MYPLASAAQQLFSSGARQRVSITVYPLEGDSFTLTEADVPNGGLRIDRYSATGQCLEIGTAIAAELSLSLNNADGRFQSVTFAGAELFLTLSVSDGAKSYPLPLGYFTVDGTPRRLKTIRMTALDRMAQFDKAISLDTITFPISAGLLFQRVCADCGVITRADISTLPNADYTIQAAPSGQGQTYRQWLIWLCQLFGRCAYIDWSGELVLGWYSAVDTELTEANRFDSDIQEKGIAVTGLRLSGSDGNEVTAGAEGYLLTVTGNALIQSDAQAVADNIFAAIQGTSYYPFEAVTMPMPWLWPLDGIAFTRGGESKQAYITHWAFTMNGRTTLIGVGESEQQNGYAAANPMTARERAIIQSLESATGKAINGAALDILHFNELLSNALGLYITEIPTESGTIRYLHDVPTLEDSVFIFTINAGGIAWTDQGWNGGSPIWQYGATSAGNAFFESLAANRINANWISAGAFTIEDANGNLIFEANKDTGTLMIGQDILNGGYVKAGIVDWDGQTPIYGVAVGQNITTETVEVDGEEAVEISGDFLAVFTAERLSFYTNGVEVAYLSNQALNITDARITGAMTQGDWEWSHGNGLTLKWIGA